MATLAFAIVGGIIGGVPGAFIGAAIGAGIDSAFLFPLIFGIDDSSVQGPQLDDLNIQTASEGSAINFCLGPTSRVAGTVIWFPDLIEEVTTTTSGGGKGGGGPTQTVTTFNYFANVAIGVCSGPIVTIRRIWADSKIIFENPVDGPVVNDARYDALRVKTGNPGQAVDAFLEGIEGVGLTPAFAHVAYVIIERLHLKDWGNRLPNFTFLVEAQASKTVGEGISDVILRGEGLVAGDIDVTQVTGNIQGYTISGPKVTTRILEPLLLAHDIRVQEKDGKLIFFDRGLEDTVVITETDLAASDRGRLTSKITLTDVAGFDLPSEVNVSYIEAANDYQKGSQREVRNDRAANVVVEIDLPLVLTGTEARDIAIARLFRPYAERQTAEVTLPPHYLTVLENDKLTVPVGDETFTLRVQEVKYGSNYLRRVTGVIESASTTVFDSGDEPPDPDPTPPYTPPGLTLLLLDIAAIRDADTIAPGLYFAICVTDPGHAWNGAALFISNDNVTYELISGHQVESFIAQARSVLAKEPVEWLDHVSTLEVEMLEGELAGITELEMLNGANRMSIGGELIGFQNATLTTLSPIVVNDPATDSGDATSATSITLSNVAVATGDALLVCFCTRDPTPADYVVTSVTFNGTDPDDQLILLQERIETGGADATQRIYGIAHPKPGTGDVVVTFAGTINRIIACAVVIRYANTTDLFKGVDATDYDQNDTNPEVELTPTVNGTLIIAAHQNYNIAFTSPDHTEEFLSAHIGGLLAMGVQSLRQETAALATMGIVANSIADTLSVAVAIRPQVVQSPIIVNDVQTDSVEAAASTVTISNVVIGTGEMLVVAISVNDSVAGDRVISTVTWNGAESLTKQVEQDETTVGHNTSLWFLFNPTAKTADVVVTLDAGPAVSLYASAMVIANVRPTVSINVVAKKEDIAGTTTPFIDITPLRDGSLIIAAYTVDEDPSPITAFGAQQRSVKDGIFETLAVQSFLQGTKALKSMGLTLSASRKSYMVAIALSPTNSEAGKQYVLKDFRRGLRDTEDKTGTHALDELGVKFSQTNIGFHGINVGVVGLTRFFKAVPEGSTVALTPSQSLILNGQTLRTFSPVHIIGKRNSSDDIAITWVRRTRSLVRLFSRGGIPQLPTIEEYAIDILSTPGGSVVATKTGILTPSFTYTAAAQTTDGLTPGDPVHVEIFQIGTALDRGKPRAATFPS